MNSDSEQPVKLLSKQDRVWIYERIEASYDVGIPVHTMLKSMAIRCHSNPDRRHLEGSIATMLVRYGAGKPPDEMIQGLGTETEAWLLGRYFQAGDIATGWKRARQAAERSKGKMETWLFRWKLRRFLTPGRRMDLYGNIIDYGMITGDGRNISYGLSTLAKHNGQCYEIYEMLSEHATILDLQTAAKGYIPEAERWALGAQKGETIANVKLAWLMASMAGSGGEKMLQAILTGGQTGFSRTKQERTAKKLEETLLVLLQGANPYSDLDRLGTLLPGVRKLRLEAACCPAREPAKVAKPARI